MKFDKSILREADIRGVYGTQIKPAFATRLGLVFGSYLRTINVKTVVVGHDNRIGGVELSKNLVDALTSTGIDVIFIGLVTTPMLNFASRELGVEYGIMVTASHNPACDNGFKLFGKNYQHCDYDELKIIYDALSNREYKIYTGKGTIKNLEINDLYSKRMRESISLGNRKMKVVVDPGNGTASIIVKKIYNRFPFDVVFINDVSDPTFPNHHPDPNVKANMKQLCDAVIEHSADLGLAYDGDADRCGFVDNNGEVIDADVLMAIMCKNILKTSENKTVLIDVKCSNTLRDEILACKGTIYLDTPSSAKQERDMEENNIIFGGSYSNHIFFRDKHPGYDDGIYVGLRVQELLSHTKLNLTDMLKKLNTYYHTDEIKVKTTDELKFKIVDAIKEYALNNNYNIDTTDGVKVIKNSSWGLLRASNTGPNLTLRFEATTKEELKNIQKEFMNVLSKIMNK